MRNRCVGLVTRDPALYAELAGALREHHLPSLSLLPGERIPDRVAVVLTSPEEAGSIRFPRVLTVARGADRAGLWAAIHDALGPERLGKELVVGIDPGPRPGYAVLSGDRCLEEGTLRDPEGVALLSHQLKRRFPSTRFVFRVGSGDPLPRDRILHSLKGVHASVELVDEYRTTPYGARHGRDRLSARLIGRSSGRLVHEAPALRVTPGEISNLQRLSREESGGRFTIPRALASRVLEGKISLSEALAEASARPVIPPSAHRHERRVREPS